MCFLGVFAKGEIRKSWSPRAKSSKEGEIRHSLLCVVRSNSRRELVCSARPCRHWVSSHVLLCAQMHDTWASRCRTGSLVTKGSKMETGNSIAISICINSTMRFSLHFEGRLLLLLLLTKASYRTRGWSSHPTPHLLRSATCICNDLLLSPVKVFFLFRHKCVC